LVDNVAPGQVFLQVFWFSLSISFHCRSIFTHVSSGGWTVGLLAAAIPQKHSVPPLPQ
jgi:hypothetical protein